MPLNQTAMFGSPFGPKVAFLSMTGRETMGRPFLFEVDLISDSDALDLKEILAKPASVIMERMLIGSMPAARVGDMMVCVGPPDVIAKGSTIVLIGGMPAARMLDLSAHGGSIAIGLPTVLIGDAGSAQQDALKNAAGSGAPFAEVCP
jgi:uncharacterized Zn-binding protein involved in type VI secretion